MGRLQQIRPTLRPLPARITTQRDDDGHSDAAEPWRAWYKTPRWKRLRREIFIRDLFTCRCCGVIEGTATNLTCDHVKPHKGDPALFWDPENLQTLLTSPCHNAKKQAEERRAPWT